MSHPTTVDPRPSVAVRGGEARVLGARCRACAEPIAFRWPRCPTCRGVVDPAEFGPGGVVWSATVVRVAVPGHVPPYGLAYVDLDDGPRVLAHVTGLDTPVPIGARVRLVDPGTGGDVRIEVA